jgi:hypothetical protein
MNDFIFNFIFSELKDRTFSSSTQFRIVLEKKYGIKDRETGTRLWTAISNYQIKKYGQSINPQNWVDLSKETLRKKGRQRRAEIHRQKRR